MLTRTQIEEYVSQIPSDINSDERRAAYATITGFAEDKSIKEIVAYYSLNQDSVTQWMDYFKFADMKNTSIAKRSNKTKKIEDYLKNNIGKSVTPKQVAEEVGMSLPTFYNFYNANRFYFKKIQRGVFEVLDPSAERNR